MRSRDEYYIKRLTSFKSHYKHWITYCWAEFPGDDRHGFVIFSTLWCSRAGHALIYHSLYSMSVCLCKALVFVARALIPISVFIKSGCCNQSLPQNVPSRVSSSSHKLTWATWRRSAPLPVSLTFVLLFCSSVGRGWDPGQRVNWTVLLPRSGATKAIALHKCPYSRENCTNWR